MGKPVVSTGLPEIRRFNETHGDVVAIADDPDQFALRVSAALDAQDDESVNRRIAVARQNSWDARLAQMSTLISDALVERRATANGWEQRLRRGYRTARRRVLRAAALAVLAYVVLFQTPFLWSVAEPLRVVDPPRRADAIVVFAGGVGESGTAGGGYQERVRHAVDLYQAGYAPRMVFSSGFVFAFQEAEVMRLLAVSLGVPASAIVLEKRASSTLGDICNVRDMMRAAGAHAVLLVSSPYHMRRAVLTWRKQAGDIDVIASPVERSQYYAHGYGARIEQVRGIAWEYAALVAYAFKGWL